MCNVQQDSVYLGACLCVHNTGSLVPRPHSKNQEKGLVTLAQISVCAVLAVFIWSRLIMLIQLPILDM